MIALNTKESKDVSYRILFELFDLRNDGVLDQEEIVMMVISI